MLYNKINTLKNATTREFRLYVESSQYARMLNTPTMARTYYTQLKVYGVEALQNKVNELKNANIQIREICTGYGTRIYCW